MNFELIDSLCDADLATRTNHLARLVNECLFSVEELTNITALCCSECGVLPHGLFYVGEDIQLCGPCTEKYM